MPAGVHAVLHSGSCWDGDCDSSADPYVVKLFDSKQTAQQFIDAHRDDWDSGCYSYSFMRVYSSLKESGMY